MKTNMITIIMSKPNALKIEFKAVSFEAGYLEALDKYEKMGLIGRYYVIGSDGSHKVINQ